MRLPADLRMKATGEFARVRAQGTSFPGRYVVLSVLRDTEVEKFRFGLITSKKLGKAVVRNRIRRSLRQVVREEQEKLADGLLLVIIGRWRASDAAVADLRHDVLRTAQRAGILKSSPPKT